uniref:Macro domain-containing protein n=1 Tax=Phytophthora ramorum TaxID=164328 RepID=H3GZ87_PHYRM
MSSPSRNGSKSPTKSPPATSTSDKVDDSLGGKVLSQWKVSDKGPELLVMQGDLTLCSADAIVNAANCQLLHGGGGVESTEWVKSHGSLSVGDAVTTAAGKLPSRYVIHTAGPNVGRATLTAEHAKLLRRAVHSALMEAHRLELTSVAVPGISTGIFGYPRDLGAKEIVTETVKFCKERGDATKVQRIALMNIDDPTVNSFVKALEDVKVRNDDVDIGEQLTGLNIRD